jgi:hypothetical protein
MKATAMTTTKEVKADSEYNVRNSKPSKHRFSASAALVYAQARLPNRSSFWIPAIFSLYLMISTSNK